MFLFTLPNCPVVPKCVVDALLLVAVCLGFADVTMQFAAVPTNAGWVHFSLTLTVFFVQFVSPHSLCLVVRCRCIRSTSNQRNLSGLTFEATEVFPIVDDDHDDEVRRARFSPPATFIVQRFMPHLQTLSCFFQLNPQKSST
mmetsp:Transcript_13864/g.19459  ORF Transcript_13864/g.19459 Transcript_13864/m.19459 type:complete len:142 (-) Transcript_13864:255-680(-)